jgi:hypothetical protein
MEIQFLPRRELSPSALQTFTVYCETHTEGIILSAEKLRSSFDKVGGANSNHCHFIVEYKGAALLIDSKMYKGRLLETGLFG